jgi:hypothetical protein
VSLILLNYNRNLLSDDYYFAPDNNVSINEQSFKFTILVL